MLAHFTVWTEFAFRCGKSQSTSSLVVPTMLRDWGQCRGAQREHGCHGGATAATPFIHLGRCHVSEKSQHISTPTAIAVAWITCSDARRKGECPQISHFSPNHITWLNKPVLRHLTNLAKLILGKLCIKEDWALSVYLSTCISLHVSYICRYTTVGQRNKTQLTPLLQCAWHLEMLHQSARATTAVSPPLLCPHGAARSGLHHQASSFAQCPPSRTGLHSSLSAHVQESHDNCRGTYFFKKKLSPTQSPPLSLLCDQRGKTHGATWLCFYFCLPDCRTPHNLASSLLKSDFHNTKYRKCALCGG